eukprot:287833-Chlamydomonas_euryale.AAC.1
MRRQSIANVDYRRVRGAKPLRTVLQVWMRFGPQVSEFSYFMYEFAEAEWKGNCRSPLGAGRGSCQSPRAWEGNLQLPAPPQRLQTRRACPPDTVRLSSALNKWHLRWTIVSAAGMPRVPSTFLRATPSTAGCTTFTRSMMMIDFTTATPSH